MSLRPLAALGQPAPAGAPTFSLHGPLDSPPSPPPASRLRGPVAVPCTSRLPDRGRGRGLSTPENQVGRLGALAAWRPLPGFGSPKCIQSAVGGQLDDRHDGASACYRSPFGCLRVNRPGGRLAAARVEAEGLFPCKAIRSKLWRLSMYATLLTTMARRQLRGCMPQAPPTARCSHHRRSSPAQPQLPGSAQTSVAQGHSPFHL